MPTAPKYPVPLTDNAVDDANGNTLAAVAVEVMAPVYEAVPNDAPAVALNCPATVVDALTASEPDVVALPKRVLPVSVVDAMSA